MKPLFFSLCLLMAFSVYSQEVETQLSNLPVKSGLIYKDKKTQTRLVNKVDGVIINTNNDSCFATEDGTVTSTFNLQGEYAILIKPSHNKFVTYSHLKTIAVKRGERIKRGMFIGLLTDKDADHQLLYMLSNNKGQVLSREEHLEYLKLNSLLSK